MPISQVFDKIGYIPLALTADLFFVLDHQLVKQVQADGTVVIEVLLVRCILTTLICTTSLSLTHTHLLRPFDTINGPSGKLWLRGGLNVLGLIFIYKGLQHITLSEAITIFHLRPFPTALLVWVVLNERFTLRQGLASVVSFVGVLLVVQPTSSGSGSSPAANHDRFLGLALTVVGTLLAALDILLVRICDDQCSLVLLLYFGAGGSIVSILWCMISQTPLGWMSPVNWALTMGTTVVGGIAQICIVEALKRAEGNTIAILAYSQIIFAVFIQFLWTGLIPSVLAFIGMGVIFLAGVWCAMETCYGEGVKEPGEGEEEGERAEGIIEE